MVLFKESAPIWKKCIEVVGFNTYDTSNLIFIAGSMYVRKYFDGASKNDIIEMANNIKRSFEDIISNSDWMSKEVKDRAKKKLFMMQQFIAYPDEFLDREKIDKLHEGIEVTQDQFFNNVLKLQKFWKKVYFSKLHDVIDPTSWMEHPLIAMVNAFYYPTNNYIEFPAGILQVS